MSISATSDSPGTLRALLTSELSWMAYMENLHGKYG